MNDIREAVVKTIDYLTDEFIVEECIGNLVEGCLSCEMIETRASLRKALYMIDEWPAVAERGVAYKVGDPEGRDD